jgi:hypothetical protein
MLFTGAGATVWPCRTLSCWRESERSRILRIADLRSEIRNRTSPPSPLPPCGDSLVMPDSVGPSSAERGGVVGGNAAMVLSAIQLRVPP